MFARPHDLDDASVAQGLVEGWSIRATVQYQAVGFGSHHWLAVDDRGVQWFVTVDDLREGMHSPADSLDDVENRLARAIGLARWLNDHGLPFALGPLRTVDGSVLRRLDRHFAIAVYPHVDSEAPGWGNFTEAHRLLVVDMIAELHKVEPPSRAVEGLTVANRHVLDAALVEVGTAWTSGPYAERARSLLAEKAAALDAALSYYDTLAGSASVQHDRVVISHGEPHAGNVLFGPEGSFLIDWDTATTSLPERDIWMVETGDGSVSERYRAATGTTIDPRMLELFRLLWDLMEIAEYVRTFRSPHAEDANTLQCWDNFQTYAAVDTRWPQLLN